jgi:hypothetical protein
MDEEVVVQKSAQPMTTWRSGARMLKSRRIEPTADRRPDVIFHLVAIRQLVVCGRIGSGAVKTSGLCSVGPLGIRHVHVGRGRAEARYSGRNLSGHILRVPQIAQTCSSGRTRISLATRLSGQHID